MEDDLPGGAQPNFSEATKIDPVLKTTNIKSAEESKGAPAKKSLDDLLRTEILPQEPAAKAGPSTGDEIFDGILDDDPAPNERISIFAKNAMPSKPEPFQGSQTEILNEATELETSRTEILVKSKPPQVRDKTIVLETEPTQEITENIKRAISPPPIALGDGEATQEEANDPVDQALNDFDGDVPSIPPLPRKSTSEVKNIESPNPDAEGEVAASDFAEGFAHQPIQVSGVHFTSPAQLKSRVKKFAVAGGAFAAVLVGLFLVHSKLQTDEGLAGYRMEGFSFIKAYRAPSAEQLAQFKTHFENAERARQTDDPKMIEESIQGLKQILAADERNFKAISLILEHASILTVWYGLKSNWPQQYDEALKKWNETLVKVKENPKEVAFERAKAWRSLALGESRRAFTELVSQVPEADPETAGLLAQLAFVAGLNDEVEKWIAKSNSDSNHRVELIKALVSKDSKAISKLAESGYIPAKVQELASQPIKKEAAAKLRDRSESLMEEVKEYPPLVDQLKSFRGSLYEALGENDKARAEWKIVVEHMPKDAQTWIKLAQSYEDESLWDESLNAYREAEKAKGLDRKSLLRFVKLLRERGKVLEGISLLDDAIKITPKDPSLHYERGMVQLTIGQEDQARASFDKALEIDQNFEPAILGVVQLALNRREWAEAETQLNRISPKSSQYPEAVQNLARISRKRYQFQQADHYYQEAIDKNPKLESAYAELADMYIEDEKADRALELLDRGQTHLPKSPVIKVALARAYQFVGKFDKELEVLDSIKQKFGHLPEVAYALADALLDQKEYASAQDIINELAEKDAKASEVYYLKARTFYLQPEAGKGAGSYEQAYRGLESALRKDPEVFRYRILAAQVLLALQDKSAAIEHLEVILKIKPKYSPALLIRGDIYRDTGDYEKATEFYLSALKSSRSPAQIYTRLADGFKSQGKPGEAIEYYKKVVSSNPSDSKAHLELGKLYSDEGRYTNALKSLESSSRLNPMGSEAFYFLGFAHKELGNRKEAIQAFEKFLQLAPSATEATTVRDEVYFLKGAPSQAN